MRNPMQNNKRNTCRLGRRPDKKGPRSKLLLLLLLLLLSSSAFVSWYLSFASLVPSISLISRRFYSPFTLLQILPVVSLFLLASPSHSYMYSSTSFFLSPPAPLSSILFWHAHSYNCCSSSFLSFSSSCSSASSSSIASFSSAPSLFCDPYLVSLPIKPPLLLFLCRSCRHFFLIFSPIPVPPPPPPPPPPPFPPLPSVRILCLISWMHLPYFMLSFYIRLPW